MKQGKANMLACKYGKTSDPSQFPKYKQFNYQQYIIQLKKKNGTGCSLTEMYTEFSLMFFDIPFKSILSILKLIKRSKSQAPDMGEKSMYVYNC